MDTHCTLNLSIAIITVLIHMFITVVGILNNILLLHNTSIVTVHNNPYNICIIVNQSLHTGYFLHDMSG